MDPMRTFPSFRLWIPKRCKGVHCVDLGESFHMSISLQNLASIQPRPIVVQVAPNFPRASSRPLGARVERTRREDRPARGRPGGSARSADALRQMRRTTRPTRALRAPRDPRRWAQGAPPPGLRDLRLLAVRESPEADAALVPHMSDAGHVAPVRPLALGARHAAAWPEAHATVRIPCPTPRRSSVVS